MDWTLKAIRKKARELTGRSTEGNLSTEDLDDYINNYYQSHLPDLLTPDSLQSLFIMNTSAMAGEYSVPTNIRALYPPVFIDDARVLFTHNVGWFFQTYKYRADQPEGQPETVLYFDRTLWMAPIPDAVYEVQIHALYRPDPLINDTDTPVDPRWGEVVAIGTAVQVFFADGDAEGAAGLSNYLKYQLDLIRQNNILNWHGMRAVPQF